MCSIQGCYLSISWYLLFSVLWVSRVLDILDILILCPSYILQIFFPFSLLLVFCYTHIKIVLSNLFHFLILLSIFSYLQIPSVSHYYTAVLLHLLLELLWWHLKSMFVNPSGINFYIKYMIPKILTSCSSTISWIFFFLYWFEMPHLSSNMFLE